MSGSSLSTVISFHPETVALECILCTILQIVVIGRVCAKYTPTPALQIFSHQSTAPL